MSATAISESLFTLLTTDQSAGTFYAAVGGRIFDGEAAQDTDLPYAVVSQIVVPVTGCYGGSDMIEARYQIDIYGAKALGMAAVGSINTKLFTVLDRAAFTPTGNSRSVVTCVTEAMCSIEEDCCRIMSEWRVRSAAL